MYYHQSNYSVNIGFLMHTKLWTLDLNAKNNFYLINIWIIQSFWCVCFCFCFCFCSFLLLFFEKLSKTTLICPLSWCLVVLESQQQSIKIKQPQIIIFPLKESRISASKSPQTSSGKKPLETAWPSGENYGKFWIIWTVQKCLSPFVLNRALNYLYNHHITTYWLQDCKVPY